MKKFTKKRITAAVLTGLAAALILWTAWGNTALQCTEWTITSGHLPKAFDGFRIAQVSDLHNAEMGDENADLLAMLEEAQPDIIVITGDAVDSSRTDIEITVAFAQQAVPIAPCYYVTGNHEGLLAKEDYAQLESGLLAAGVDVLHDESVILERDGAQISLLGADDPAFTSDAPTANTVTSLMLPKELQTLAGDAAFTILLSHRPELFANYTEAGMDVVFTGHAHGGQFRFPFIGGLLAPDQGLFPKYDAGVFAEGRTHMVVSRGVGNSAFPFRFNNRPEVVVVTLEGE